VDLERHVAVGYKHDEDEINLVTPPGQLLTGDHNLVNIQVVIDFNVRADQVERYVLQSDRADDLVARAAETAVAEWVAGHTVDDVLLQGKIDLPRWLVTRTQEFIQPYALG